VNGHLKNLRTIDIRLLDAYCSAIRLPRFVLWVLAAVFSMLSITFPANMPPAFAQEDSNFVKQQVDSLLEEVGSVQARLDEFGNPERLFAPDATESIRKLGNQLSSIEQKRREIVRDKAVAKLKETEKEEFQNKLDNLKDETSALQMQVKMLLQYVPLFQSLKSLIDKSNQSLMQKVGTTIVPYILLFGIVVLIILGVLEFLWHRQNYSRRLDKLARLQQQTLLKIEELERPLFGVKSLIQKVNSIESTLRNLVQLIQKQQTPIRQEPQPQKTQNDLLQKESPLQTFCHLYNAVEGSNEQDEFIRRYQPVQVSVANVMERRRDLSIEPVFQTVPSGNYYAVAIEGSMLYAVVPCFDLAFQDSSYGPGAMGQVFDCPNYNPQLCYRNVKVVKPAFFEPDSAKQHWTLKEKGELDLGQGE